MAQSELPEVIDMDHHEDGPASNNLTGPNAPNPVPNKADSNASFLRAARAGHFDKVLEYLRNGVDINASNSNGLNALHLASKEGHHEVVRELLRRGANVDSSTRKGNTALHIACLAGQDMIVTILVEHGASVNAQSLNGFTPLYMAAQENHEDVVRFLLTSGANQVLATEDGFTPLAVALQQGHDKIVALLLENDGKGKVRLPALHIAAKKDDTKAATLLLQNDNNADVTSKSGFTPLHIAAHYGNENMAKLLLERNANVNFQARHNISPLHVAAKWGRTNLANLLISSGALIDCRTRDLLTPLHCAARSGHEQVVELLLEKGAPISARTKNGLSPLHMGSQGDHVECARILLYHRANVDDVTVDYLTPLHVAAHCGHVRVAKLLLDRQADPNARALNGFTPLHIACKKNRIKVVELLLKYNASVQATTESGLSPLHVASFMGCIQIVIYLLQQGANVDCETVRGETPLHLAARANQTDIVRVLLRNSANVNALAREHQTPLHIAARLGNIDIVSLLLQAQANPNAMTKDQYTPLHIAAKEGQEDVAQILLDLGADKTLLTKKGFTPLHLAAKYGNDAVARLLLEKKTPVDIQGKNQVTPLHVAAHYNNDKVALLLLENKASAQATAKNGYTPLHIAAKKNQMDITGALLQYHADTNAESKAGFTPLHLAAEEGHREMAALLIENKGNVNAQAKNGLTPMHLCAQENRVPVAEELVKANADIDSQTKAGYTPLHVACHFGKLNMVQFLIENGAKIGALTKANYTPLHQAAQQGHNSVVRYLLENGASPNTQTSNGQTPLSIAQRLGYVSVVETLKTVTETTVITETTTVTEERYKPQNPEGMNETMFSDSDDEAETDQAVAQYHAKDFSESLTQGLRDSASIHLIHTGEQLLMRNSEIDTTDAELDAVIRKAQTQPVSTAMLENDNYYFENSQDDNMSPTTHNPVNPSFLISFLCDARGGAMRGCRHSGVRIIVPPRKAAAPVRVTCRYLKKEKLNHPPPLSEGEALASRILEMGPAGAKFLGPVILEVPHFASLRGREREIVILRSDDGQHWKEHQLEATEDAVQEVLNESFDPNELSQLDDLHTPRITRILTNDFPMYFAVVTRVRQEVHCVGPEGGVILSSVVPKVQAIFPDGSLTKTIKVSLQAQPVPQELVAKLHGNRVAVSPIVTVEPRRRKFHKPITLCIPLPQGTRKGMLTQYNNQSGQEPPTLRLLCSITGGSAPAQWEDITGTTQLTFTGDEVSFTTTVSARFWLMDCQTPRDAARMAQEVYNDAISVPYMAKFVIFAKRPFPIEGQIRLFCMTDDKEDKTLEKQENFREVARSRDVEVLSNRHHFLEFAGNIQPVTKSGEQLSIFFMPFQENRLCFNVKVKTHMDEEGNNGGKIAIMKEPRTRTESIGPQTPVCQLSTNMPDYTGPLPTPTFTTKANITPLTAKYQKVLASTCDDEMVGDIPVGYIAKKVELDWPRLARALNISDSDIKQIRREMNGKEPWSAIKIWIHLKKSEATLAELEKSLIKIGRDDIVRALNKSNNDTEGESLRLIDFNNASPCSLEKMKIKTESLNLTLPAGRESSQIKTVTVTERRVHDENDGVPIVDEHSVTTVYADDETVDKIVVNRTVPLTEEEHERWVEDVKEGEPNSKEDMIVVHEDETDDGVHVQTTTIVTSHTILDHQEQVDGEGMEEQPTSSSIHVDQMPQGEIVSSEEMEIEESHQFAPNHQNIVADSPTAHEQESEDNDSMSSVIIKENESDDNDGVPSPANQHRKVPPQETQHLLADLEEQRIALNNMLVQLKSMPKNDKEKFFAVVQRLMELEEELKMSGINVPKDHALFESVVSAMLKDYPNTDLQIIATSNRRITTTKMSYEADTPGMDNKEDSEVMATQRKLLNEICEKDDSKESGLRGSQDNVQQVEKVDESFTDEDGQVVSRRMVRNVTTTQTTYHSQDGSPESQLDVKKQDERDDKEDTHESDEDDNSSQVSRSVKDKIAQFETVFTRPPTQSVSSSIHSVKEGSPSLSSNVEMAEMPLHGLDDEKGSEISEQEVLESPVVETSSIASVSRLSAMFEAGDIDFNNQPKIPQDRQKEISEIEQERRVTTTIVTKKIVKKAGDGEFEDEEYESQDFSTNHELPIEKVSPSTIPNLAADKLSKIMQVPTLEDKTSYELTTQPYEINRQTSPTLDTSIQKEEDVSGSDVEEFVAHTPIDYSVSAEETYLDEKEASVVERESPVIGKESPVVEKESPVVERESPVVERESPIVKGDLLSAESPIVEKEVAIAESPIIKRESPIEESPIIEKELPIDVSRVVEGESPIDVSPIVEKELPIGESLIIEREHLVAESSVVESPIVEKELPISESPIIERESPLAESPVVERKSPIVEKESPIVESPIIERESSVRESPVIGKESLVAGSVVAGLLVAGSLVAGSLVTESPVTESPIIEKKSPVAESPVIEKESPIIEKDVSVIESPVIERESLIAESPIIEKDTTTPDTESPFAELESPVIEEVSPVLDLESSVVEKESPIVNLESLVTEKRSPVSELESPVMKGESFVTEIESPAIEDTSLVVALESPAIEKQSLVGEVESLVVELDSSVSEKESSIGELESPVVIEKESPIVELEQPIEKESSLLEIESPVVIEEKIESPISEERLFEKEIKDEIGDTSDSKNIINDSSTLGETIFQTVTTRTYYDKDGEEFEDIHVPESDKSLPYSDDSIGREESVSDSQVEEFEEIGMEGGSISDLENDNEAMVTETTVHTEEAIAESPFDREEVIGESPIDRGEVVSKSPVQQIVTKSPVHEQESISKSTVQEVVAESPIHEEELVPGSLTHRVEVTSASPVLEEQYISKSPIQEVGYESSAHREEAISTSPVLEEEFISTSPIYKEEIISQSISHGEEVLAESPIYKDEIVAKSPVYDQEFLSKSPVQEQQRIIESSMEKTEFYKEQSDVEQDAQKEHFDDESEGQEHILAGSPVNQQIATDDGQSHYMPETRIEQRETVIESPIHDKYAKETFEQTDLYHTELSDVSPIEQKSSIVESPVYEKEPSDIDDEEHFIHKREISDIQEELPTFDKEASATSSTQLIADKEIQSPLYEPIVQSPVYEQEPLTIDAESLIPETESPDISSVQHQELYDVYAESPTYDRRVSDVPSIQKEPSSDLSPDSEKGAFATSPIDEEEIIERQKYYEEESSDISPIQAKEFINESPTHEEELIEHEKIEIVAVSPIEYEKTIVEDQEFRSESPIEHHQIISESPIEHDKVISESPLQKEESFDARRETIAGSPLQREELFVEDHEIISESPIQSEGSFVDHHEAMNESPVPEEESLTRQYETISESPIEGHQMISESPIKDREPISESPIQRGELLLEEQEVLSEYPTQKEESLVEHSQSISESPVQREESFDDHHKFISGPPIEHDKIVCESPIQKEESFGEHHEIISESPIQKEESFGEHREIISESPVEHHEVISESPIQREESFGEHHEVISESPIQREESFVDHHEVISESPIQREESFGEHHDIISESPIESRKSISKSPIQREESFGEPYEVVSESTIEHREVTSESPIHKEGIFVESSIHDIESTEHKIILSESPINQEQMYPEAPVSEIEITIDSPKEHDDKYIQSPVQESEVVSDDIEEHKVIQKTLEEDFTSEYSQIHKEIEQVSPLHEKDFTSQSSLHSEDYIIESQVSEEEIIPEKLSHDYEDTISKTPEHEKESISEGHLESPVYHGETVSEVSVGESSVEHVESSISEKEETSHESPKDYEPLMEISSTAEGLIEEVSPIQEKEFVSESFEKISDEPLILDTMQKSLIEDKIGSPVKEQVSFFEMIEEDKKTFNKIPAEIEESSTELINEQKELISESPVQESEHDLSTQKEESSHPSSLKESISVETVDYHHKDWVDTPVDKTEELVSETASQYKNEFVESPVYEKEFIPESPIDDKHIVSESPIQEREFISESPDHEGEFVLVSDVQKEEFIPESPVHDKEYIQEPTVEEKKIISESPIVEREFISESPIVEREFISESPIIEREFISESPIVEKEFIPESPKHEKEFIEESSDEEREVIPESPNVTKEFTSESPVVEEEFISESPIVERESIPTSPTKAEEYILESPVVEKEFISKSSIVEKESVVEAPDQEMQFISESPSKDEEFILESSVIERELIAESPTKEEKFISESPVHEKELIQESLIEKVDTPKHDLFIESSTLEKDFIVESPVYQKESFDVSPIHEDSLITKRETSSIQDEQLPELSPEYIQPIASQFIATFESSEARFRAYNIPRFLKQFEDEEDKTLISESQFKSEKNDDETQRPYELESSNIMPTVVQTAVIAGSLLKNGNVFDHTKSYEETNIAEEITHPKSFVEEKDTNHDEPSTFFTGSPIHKSEFTDVTPESEEQFVLETYSQDDEDEQSKLAKTSQLQAHEKESFTESPVENIESHKEESFGESPIEQKEFVSHKEESLAESPIEHKEFVSHQEESLAESFTESPIGHKEFVSHKEESFDESPVEHKEFESHKEESLTESPVEHIEFVSHKEESVGESPVEQQEFVSHKEESFGESPVEHKEFISEPHLSVESPVEHKEVASESPVPDSIEIIEYKNILEEPIETFDVSSPQTEDLFADKLPEQIESPTYHKESIPESFVDQQNRPIEEEVGQHTSPTEHLIESSDKDDNLVDYSPTEETQKVIIPQLVGAESAQDKDAEESANIVESESPMYPREQDFVREYSKGDSLSKSSFKAESEKLRDSADNLLISESAKDTFEVIERADSPINRRFSLSVGDENIVGSTSPVIEHYGRAEFESKDGESPSENINFVTSSPVHRHSLSRVSVSSEGNKMETTFEQFEERDIEESQFSSLSSIKQPESISEIDYHQVSPIGKTFSEHKDDIKQSTSDDFLNEEKDVVSQYSVEHIESPEQKDQFKEQTFYESEESFDASPIIEEQPYGVSSPRDLTLASEIEQPKSLVESPVSNVYAGSERRFSDLSSTNDEIIIPEQIHESKDTPNNSPVDTKTDSQSIEAESATYEHQEYDPSDDREHQDIYNESYVYKKQLSEESIGEQAHQGISSESSIYERKHSDVPSIQKEGSSGVSPDSVKELIAKDTNVESLTESLVHRGEFDYEKDVEDFLQQSPIRERMDISESPTSMEQYDALHEEKDYIGESPLNEEEFIIESPPYEKESVDDKKFISQSPVHDTEFISQSPVHDTELIHESPAHGKELIPQYPVQEREFIHESPTHESEIIQEYSTQESEVTQHSPSHKRESISEYHLEEKEIIEELSSKDSESIPESAVLEKELLSESPVLEKEMIPESPVQEKELISEGQVIEEEFIPTSPLSNKEFVCESPSREEELICESSLSEKELIADLDDSQPIVNAPEYQAHKMYPEHKITSEHQEFIEGTSPAAHESAIDTESPVHIEETSVDYEQFIEHTQMEHTEATVGKQYEQVEHCTQSSADLISQAIGEHEDGSVDEDLIHGKRDTRNIPEIEVTTHDEQYSESESSMTSKQSYYLEEDQTENNEVVATLDAEEEFEELPVLKTYGSSESPINEETFDIIESADDEIKHEKEDIVESNIFRSDSVTVQLPTTQVEIPSSLSPKKARSESPLVYSPTSSVSVQNNEMQSTISIESDSFPISPQQKASEEHYLSKDDLHKESDYEFGGPQIKEETKQDLNDEYDHDPSPSAHHETSERKIVEPVSFDFINEFAENLTNKVLTSDIFEEDVDTKSSKAQSEQEYALSKSEDELDLLKSEEELNLLESRPNISDAEQAIIDRQAQEMVDAITKDIQENFFTEIDDMSEKSEKFDLLSDDMDEYCDEASVRQHTLERGDSIPDAIRTLDQHTIVSDHTSDTALAKENAALMDYASSISQNLLASSIDNLVASPEIMATQNISQEQFDEPEEFDSVVKQRYDRHIGDVKDVDDMSGSQVSDVKYIGSGSHVSDARMSPSQMSEVKDRMSTSQMSEDRMSVSQISEDRDRMSASQTSDLNADYEHHDVPQDPHFDLMTSSVYQHPVDYEQSDEEELHVESANRESYGSSASSPNPFLTHGEYEINDPDNIFLSDDSDNVVERSDSNSDIPARDNYMLRSTTTETVIERKIEHSPELETSFNVLTDDEKKESLTDDKDVRKQIEKEFELNIDSGESSLRQEESKLQTDESTDLESPQTIIDNYEIIPESIDDDNGDSNKLVDEETSYDDLSDDSLVQDNAVSTPPAVVDAFIIDDKSLERRIHTGEKNHHNRGGISVSYDNISESSLQEFERLEAELNKKSGDISPSSDDSRKNDHIERADSKNSLNEFESVEKEIAETEAASSDIMMLSNIIEESESEVMSTKEDISDMAHFSAEHKASHDDLTCADSLEQIDRILETSIDSLDNSNAFVSYEHRKSSQNSDDDEDMNKSYYPEQFSPNTIRNSNYDTMDRDSLLEQSTGPTYDSSTTVTTTQTTDNTFSEYREDDKDSLDGDLSNVIDSYTTTVTTFQTTQTTPTGSTETISRRVLTKVTDPLICRVKFTGTESEDRLKQLSPDVSLETKDTEGNVTITTKKSSDHKQ
uniref:ANK_REP_REGION domain-containing protein n=1 Tax=Rhabditophanes sp. KR3021 TaxID=114890 RepID=A0AC35TXI0_9BILA